MWRSQPNLTKDTKNSIFIQPYLYYMWTNSFFVTNIQWKKKTDRIFQCCLFDLMCELFFGIQNICMVNVWLVGLIDLFLPIFIYFSFSSFSSLKCSDGWLCSAVTCTISTWPNLCVHERPLQPYRRFFSHRHIWLPFDSFFALTYE